MASRETYLCPKNKDMTLYDAIDQMKMLSQEGKSFSFTFMTYSIDKHVSHGLRHVAKARLVKRTRKEKNQYGEYMLQYIDLESMQRSQFWMPLLVEFNGEQVILN